MYHIVLIPISAAERPSIIIYRPPIVLDPQLSYLRPQTQTLTSSYSPLHNQITSSEEQQWRQAQIRQQTRAQLRLSPPPTQQYTRLVPDPRLCQQAGRQMRPPRPLTRYRDRDERDRQDARRRRREGRAENGLLDLLYRSFLNQ